MAIKNLPFNYLERVVHLHFVSDCLGKQQD